MNQAQTSDIQPITFYAVVWPKGEVSDRIVTNALRSGSLRMAKNDLKRMTDVCDAVFIYQTDQLVRPGEPVSVKPEDKPIAIKRADKSTWEATFYHAHQ